MVDGFLELTDRFEDPVNINKLYIHVVFIEHYCHSIKHITVI